jgi:hypothetical protein
MIPATWRELGRFDPKTTAGLRRGWCWLPRAWSASVRSCLRSVRPLFSIAIIGLTINVIAGFFR